MADRELSGQVVLVVEDEYLLAEDLSQELRDAGAEILGPVATVADGMAIIERGESINAAVLDVNLHGEMVFPVADALRERGVLFAFITGYDLWALPERFADTPRFGKPINVALVRKLLAPITKPDG